jgi:hypothetical protein
MPASNTVTDDRIVALVKHKLETELTGVRIQWLGMVNAREGSKEVR